MRFYIFSVLMLISGVSLFAIQPQNASEKDKIEIHLAQNGLGCPFLSPKLEKCLKLYAAATDIQIFGVEGYIEFNLPDTTTFDEQKLIKLTRETGYPLDIISVKYPVTESPNGE